MHKWLDVCTYIGCRCSGTGLMVQSLAHTRLELVWRIWLNANVFPPQVMREVGWVIFDEIHYMRDPGMCVTQFEREVRSITYSGGRLLRASTCLYHRIEQYFSSILTYVLLWLVTAERGVVWEETIILLPDNVHYVFLSATIPNATQFAEWICHLHKQVIV